MTNVTTDAFAAILADYGKLSDLSAAVGSAMVGFLPSGTGAGVRTAASKLAERITPQDFLCVGDGIADDTVNLQKFATYISNNQVLHAAMIGTFKISADITFTAGASYTRDLYCHCVINATHTSEGAIVTFTGFNFGSLSGNLAINGNGTATWSTRTNGTCLAIFNCSRFNNAAFIETSFAKYYGVTIAGASIGAQFNYLQTRYCGSTISGASGTTLGFTARADAGSSGSYTQTSVLTVASVPVGVVAGVTMCKIGSTLHQITATSGTTVTVFPWLDSAATTGTMQLYMGGSVYLSGVNAGCARFTRVDSFFCAVGIYDAALYGATVGYHVTQFCGVGHLLGLTNNSSLVGGNAHHTYFEGNDFDIKQLTSANVGFTFTTTSALTLSKCGTCPPKTGAFLESPNAQAFNGVSLGKDGVFYQTANALPANTGASLINLSPLPEPISMTAVYANSQNFNLNSNADANRMFAMNDVWVIGRGSGATGGPTGTYTFTPEAGISINGGGVGVAATFSQMTGPTLFHATLVGTDWKLIAAPLGYRAPTQTSKSANYTTTANDAGSILFHPSADVTARTWTIDSNATVPYPVGTAIEFINQNGAGVITIAITTDTMRLAGAGTTGNRTLAANGRAKAWKVTPTEWLIDGAGLT